MRLQISPNLFSKSCVHSEDKYIDEDYEEIIESEDVIEIHKGIRKVCSICNQQWGRSRSQIFITKSKNAFEDITLTSSEKEVFKALFNDLFRKNRTTLFKVNDKIRLRLKSSNPNDFIQKFFQKNVIEEVRIPSYSSKSDKLYINLTKLGKEFVKRQLNVLLPEEQIKYLKEEADRVLTINLKPLNDYHYKLLKFLRKISEKLDKENPTFSCNNNTKIYPQLSATLNPYFLKIIKGFIIWCEIYREGMTLRELSSKAFTIFPINLNIDASKVISTGSIKDKFRNFVVFNLGFEIEDAGLFFNYESADFSGIIHLEYNNNEFKVIESPIFMITNLFFHRIRKIILPTKKILLVENLSVLSQIALDDYALKKKLTVLYLGGKPSKFLQKILEKIVEWNQDFYCYLWVDYDLGGLQILNIIKSIMKNCTFKIILPPTDYKVPKIDISNDLKEKLLEFKFFNSNKESIKLAEWIMENGSIEQEFFLGDYLEFLDTENGVK